MADQFDLNNLELDDNSREVLPDGDYKFTVASHEFGYYSGDSTKIPPNTQQITVMLEIPFYKDGVVSMAKVRNQFNVYAKAMFAIRQFVEAIKLVPEKGRQKINIDDIDGRTGVCSLTTVESKNGNEFNNVAMFYPPSKAPLKTANDDAWEHRDDPLEVPAVPDDLEVPFEI